MFRFSVLSDDLLIEIISCLFPKEFLSFSRTEKAQKHLIPNENIWKIMILNEFGFEDLDHYRRWEMDKNENPNPNDKKKKKGKGKWKSESKTFPSLIDKSFTPHSISHSSSPSFSSSSSSSSPSSLYVSLFRHLILSFPPAYRQKYCEHSDQKSFPINTLRRPFTSSEKSISNNNNNNNNNTNNNNNSCSSSLHSPSPSSPSSILCLQYQISPSLSPITLMKSLWHRLYSSLRNKNIIPNGFAIFPTLEDGVSEEILRDFEKKFNDFGLEERKNKDIKFPLEYCSTMRIHNGQSPSCRMHSMLVMSQIEGEMRRAQERHEEGEEEEEEEEGEGENDENDNEVNDIIETKMDDANALDDDDDVADDVESDIASSSSSSPVSSPLPDKFYGLFGGFSFYDFHSDFIFLSLSQSFNFRRRLGEVLILPNSVYLVPIALNAAQQIDNPTMYCLNERGEVVKFNPRTEDIIHPAKHTAKIVANSFYEFFRHHVENLENGIYITNDSHHNRKSHYIINRFPNIHKNNSECVTRGIRIRVSVLYVSEQNLRFRNQFVFTYKIRIDYHENKEGKEGRQGRVTDITPKWKLTTRHWRITHEDGKVEEVSGEGVIGLFPVIHPNMKTIFSYESCTSLPTTKGMMEGILKFRNLNSEEGEQIDAVVEPFKFCVETSAV